MRILLVVSLSLVCVPMVPVAGQAQSVEPAGWTPPRMADGRPDLQGVWDYRTMTPLERPTSLADTPFFTPEEAAAYERESVARRNKDRRTEDGLSVQADVAAAYNEFWWDYGKALSDLRTSLIVDPPDGRIPALTPEATAAAAARREARRGRGPTPGPEHRGLWERCLTLGVPRLSGAYNNNFQLFQAADHVVILNEMIHDARIIPLDGRPHVDGQIRQWLGNSRGRWDGDTLVVETTNFTDRTSFRGAREHLHLTERFTRVGPGTLLYEVTVEDPTTFERPWTFALPMHRNDSLVYEYACHEGNYGMVNLLLGARVEDAALAAADSR
ncbi:MAG: hypothetical protein E2P06_11255 [Acidobacteria bacterium]|nr:MAG: hypothetical protein E2P06_11255 [Acidobacteriota bacterium]